MNKSHIVDLDGSRTRVRKPIPCPSTIIVSYLTFPPACPGELTLPEHFSSFMIRPYAQSLAYVVSCIVDAWVTRVRGALSQTAAIRQRIAKLSSAFNFRFCDLTHRLADSFSSFISPRRNLYWPLKVYLHTILVYAGFKNVNGMNGIFCSDMSIKAERRNSFYGGFGSQNGHRMLYLWQKEICISVKKHKMDKKTGYDN